MLQEYTGSPFSSLASLVMNILRSHQSFGFLDDSVSSISLDEGSIGSVFTTTPGSVSASGAVDDEGLSKSETGDGEIGD